MITEKSLKTGNWKLEISPKRSLGQNFLINAGILEKIVSAAELSLNDTVLEIGPGTGNLTKPLSEKAGQVIAIEKDPRLIEELHEKFKNTNVTIIEGDILKLDIEKLFENCKLKIENCDYKVIANIPYYITSNLLRTIFEKWPRPKLIVLTIQKEVAQRIVAKPPNMSLLALSVQFYAEPKIIGYISRGSFRPMPKVDSAIIRLTPLQGPLSEARLRGSEKFFKVAKAGFSGKRKQLINNLSKNFGIIRGDLLKAFKEVGIEPDVRAENLSLEQWLTLSKKID